MAEEASANLEQNLDESKQPENVDTGEEKVDDMEVPPQDQEQIDTPEGEHIEGEQVEGEHNDGEQTEGEQTEVEGEEHVLGEGELMGEGELVTEEEPEKKEDQPVVEVVEEEEVYVEEPPPDPAAPYDFTDSKERLREPFELRPEQLAEVEQLWEIFQNYTPAYTDLDDYITETEVTYMLKSLFLMTYTPEQLQELIYFCVRPPHPEGHINYQQFLKMVTLRQRDMVMEEELRGCLQILDPEKTGTIDREYFREVLSKMGSKMIPKQLEFLIKEVDISNDGTLGIDDIVGTMCVDLNRDDIIMLREAIYPSEKREEPEPEF